MLIQRTKLDCMFINIKSLWLRLEAIQWYIFETFPITHNFRTYCIMISGEYSVSLNFYKIKIFLPAMPYQKVASITYINYCAQKQRNFIFSCNNNKYRLRMNNKSFCFKINWSYRKWTKTITYTLKLFDKWSIHSYLLSYVQIMPTIWLKQTFS